MNLPEQQNTQLAALNVPRSELEVACSVASHRVSLFTAQCHLIDDITERAAPKCHGLSDMFAKTLPPSAFRLTPSEVLG